ncbi:MAG TPA: LysR family transcriptional regulator [Polyangia bacterium]|nr:LysR family transcriptional regulator [Polyangia bacterium]
MFDWNDARFFLAIARAGSLSGAARALRVQQSTMGRRLAALEEALGARLFERTPDGYLLTAAGESLRKRTERIEDEALSAERELLGQEARIAGVVRLTTPEAFGNLFLAPLLARLRVEQPDILVEVVAENATLSLTRREADLAMRTGRPRQPLLLMRKLAPLNNGLYAARAYLERRGRPQGGDLEGHDYVDYDESYAGGKEQLWYTQLARGGRCTLRVNGSHGMAGAIEAGLGVGVLPCWMGDAMPALERVLPAEVHSEDVWLVMHRDLRQVARIRVVADFFTREIARLAPRLTGRRSRA